MLKKFLKKSKFYKITLKYFGWSGSPSLWSFGGASSQCPSLTKRVRSNSIHKTARARVVTIHNKMSLGLVFPPATLETAVSVVGIAASVMSGISEAKGKHLAYSKFATAGAATAQVPSRIAMVSVYTPAFIVGAASFWAFPNSSGLRFLLLKSAITAHFFKRIFEVINHPI